ncbi:ribosomal small subunit pseudouridine synthase A [Bisgaardia hudsonensis]|uniref:Pseudouridine synthase n=2 Tax=Bisgaardia hudsonensis TaxID=109472 RepID=A0A4R2N2F3_9PAST|nr:ribosomal small subunit pseudouridine synthase A [Bisgaardia hudsonensis]
MLLLYKLNYPYSVILFIKKTGRINQTEIINKHSIMRLDKYLAENLGLTRSQANKFLRSGLINLNGKIIKSGSTQVTVEDEIICDGKQLGWYEAGQYIMLYKPQGYVCSHTDDNYPSIYQFFDYPLLGKIHSAGRLDADTTGLILLTDDGNWSHRITSPKYHCEKTYLVSLADPVEDYYQQSCYDGILLRGEKELTKPAKLEIIDDYNVNLTLSEGRYHQVKRMFAALGNKVIGLHRWRIGNIVLDDNLQEGEFRHLTQQELDTFNKL